MTALDGLTFETPVCFLYLNVLVSCIVVCVQDLSTSIKLNKCVHACVCCRHKLLQEHQSSHSQEVFSNKVRREFNDFLQPSKFCHENISCVDFSINV